MSKRYDCNCNGKEWHDAFIKVINFAKEHLNEEQFNEFVYQAYIRGMENVFISETPIYENMEWHGHVVAKRIVRTDYMVGIIDRAEAYVEPCDKKWEHKIEL